jgi:hypothetical protein
MSEQPQEWTPEYVDRLVTTSYDGRRIADAHNAALAALRDDHTRRTNSLQDFYSRQLAAEREKLAIFIEQQGRTSATQASILMLEDLKRKLYAERENTKILAAALLDVRGYDHDRVDAVLARLKQSAAGNSGGSFHTSDSERVV